MGQFVKKLSSWSPSWSVFLNCSSLYHWYLCCDQVLSAIISSCCCGQGLEASYLIIILLWSVVGGQLRTHSLERPFRRAFGKNDRGRSSRVYKFRSFEVFFRVEEAQIQGLWDLEFGFKIQEKFARVSR